MRRFRIRRGRPDDLDDLGRERLGELRARETLKPRTGNVRRIKLPRGATRVRKNM